jgi:hypothetical protein|nr:MAG TPA: ASCH domain protein [Caudoviricetes sp.]
MKAFSIQQPWGTLICSGLKDVENRKWALKSTPMRVLIHVGARKHNIDEETMPLVWANPIENAQTMGIIPTIAEMPTSAIVGVATIDRCEEENFSIWAQEGHGAEYKWVMRDVMLFKEPILNVKGKLGIFDLPDITEDNLPECVNVPPVTRDGTHMTIPLCSDFFNQLQDGEADSVFFNLTNDNLALFATKAYKPKNTERVTFVCGDESLEANVAQYTIEPVCEAGSESPITFTDAFDREYSWYRVYIRIE